MPYMCVLSKENGIPQNNIYVARLMGRCQNNKLIHARISKMIRRKQKQKTTEWTNACEQHNSLLIFNDIFDSYVNT